MKKFDKWMNDAFELLPSYGKFSYYIGAIGVVFGVPFVPRILLFICVMITTILLFRPMCGQIAYDIRMWGIRKYPEQHQQILEEKRLKEMKKRDPNAYAEYVLGNRRIK